MKCVKDEKEVLDTIDDIKNVEEELELKLKVVYENYYRCHHFI